MRKLSLLLLSAVVLAACGGPDIPEIDVPDKDDIQAQINEQLIEAGLDPLDYDALEAEMEMDYDEAGEALDIPSKTVTIDAKDTTVLAIWSDVAALAQEAFPGAVLVGYTNHFAQFGDDYIVPRDRTTDGVYDSWVFIFASDEAALSDGLLRGESESFAVNYFEGELSLIATELGDEEVDGDQLFGEELVNVDTDTMVENAIAAVEAEYEMGDLIHVSFTCVPTWPTTFADGKGDCELTLYETTDIGYAVDVTPIDGQVVMVKPVEFFEI